MKTVVLRLKDVAKGTFKKINTYEFNIDQNNTVGAQGFIILSAIQSKLSSLTAKGADFYDDNTYNTKLGSVYNLKKDVNTMYFKVTNPECSLTISNCHNIYGIGSGGYLFGDISSRPGGIFPSEDLDNFANVNVLCISRSEFVGIYSDIPDTVNDLRLEGVGVTDNIANIKSDKLTYLRLIQPLVTGDYSSWRGKTINTFIGELPLVTGDVADFLDVKNITFLSIGNYLNSNAFSNYPITCSLDETKYFPRLSLFCTKMIEMDRTTLLNTLKSLARTQWLTFSGYGDYQVTLRTSMTESSFNSDNELTNAKTALERVLDRQLKIYYSE